jgi:hypothetical protein
MTTAVEDRIARALERYADAPMTIDLDAVRRGARRRRARRRTGTALTIAALAGGAVTAIAVRAADPPPTDGPVATAPELPPFGAAALLPADIFGPPTEVAAQRRATWNVALPRIDVWESGAQRIVVHTHPAATDADAPAVEATAVPATTAPVTTATPSPDDVVDLPGSATGVVEQLADDQWVMYLSAERSQGDFVIARGMSRSAAERAFRSLVIVGDALQPAEGYRRVEHADASPPSTPSSWYSQVGFGARAEFANVPDTYVVVSEPTAGRDSLELAAAHMPVAILDIGGREVAELRFDGDRSYMWRDPIGVYVTVWSFAELVERDTIADIVAGTRLIGPPEFHAIADGISSTRSAEPEVAHADVGSTRLTLRGTQTNVVLCIAAVEAEHCTLDYNASINEPPINSTIDAVVDGEWIIAGVYELTQDRDRPDLGDERYTLPDGTDAPITVVESDGRLWWTARVPVGVDRVTTHWENDTGGIVGTVTRPIVIGPLG